MNMPDSKKKIVLVIPSLFTGGAERVMSLLHRNFSQEHDVTLVIYHGPVNYPIDGEIINLELKNKGAFSSIINIFRRTFNLRKVFKALKPDLIISFIGNLQPILTGYPVIVSIRIDLDYADEFSMPWLHKLQLKTLYRLPNVRKIVPVSYGIEKKLKDRYGFTNLTTIHNPLDMDMIDTMLEGERPFEFEYIVTVGAIKMQNGFDTLLKAYAQTEAKNHLKLVIVGDGPMREEIEALIKSLGLEDRVVLTGRQKNPFIYMRHSSMFILSSRYEGFPNVLIEALACGAACIATDCETGPNEIITPGENGILIPVGDEAALANNIDRLFSDDSLRSKFRQQARQSVSHLQLSKVGQKWLELID